MSSCTREQVLPSPRTDRLRQWRRNEGAGAGVLPLQVLVSSSPSLETRLERVVVDPSLVVVDRGSLFPFLLKDDSECRSRCPGTRAPVVSVPFHLWGVVSTLQPQVSRLVQTPIEKLKVGLVPPPSFQLRRLLSSSSSSSVLQQALALDQVSRLKPPPSELRLTEAPSLPLRIRQSRLLLARSLRPRHSALLSVRSHACQYKLTELTSPFPFDTELHQLRLSSPSRSTARFALNSLR